MKNKIMNRNFFKQALGTFALATSALSVNAAQVTSLPGGTVFTMPAVNYFGSGPETLAPGVTWSSGNPGSVFGYTGDYGFSSNGLWNGLTMIGTNDPTSTMTVKFDTAVQGVGAFINWAPNTGSASIAVYDSSNVLIESSAITFLTSGGPNTGEFHGFQEATTDISYFTFTGAFIGAANLTVSAVPEPETYAMVLAGLGLIGFAARRQRKV